MTRNVLVTNVMKTITALDVALQWVVNPPFYLPRLYSTWYDWVRLTYPSYHIDREDAEDWVHAQFPESTTEPNVE